MDSTPSMGKSAQFYDFYQQVCGWLVLRLFVFVCVSTIITCAIITLRTLLPFNFTLVDLTTALSTGVATMSTLAQL